MKWLILSTLVAFNVRAHFELGVYKGVDLQNKECAIEFVSKDFYGDVKHPLNEAVGVKVADTSIVLFHDVIIDDESGKISAQKNDLRSYWASEETVSEAFRVFMGHEDGQDGPTHYTWNLYDSEYEESLVYTCRNLKFQK